MDLACSIQGPAFQVEPQGFQVEGRRSQYTIPIRIHIIRVYVARNMQSADALSLRFFFFITLKPRVE